MIVTDRVRRELPLLVGSLVVLVAVFASILLVREISLLMVELRSGLIQQSDADRVWETYSFLNSFTPSVITAAGLGLVGILALCARRWDLRRRTAKPSSPEPIA